MGWYENFGDPAAIGNPMLADAQRKFLEGIGYTGWGSQGGGALDNAEVANELAMRKEQQQRDQRREYENSGSPNASTTNDLVGMPDSGIADRAGGINFFDPGDSAFGSDRRGGIHSGYIDMGFMENPFGTNIGRGVAQDLAGKAFGDNKIAQGLAGAVGDKAMPNITNMALGLAGVPMTGTIGKLVGKIIKGKNDDKRDEWISQLTDEIGIETGNMSPASGQTPSGLPADPEERFNVVKGWFDNAATVKNINELDQWWDSDNRNANIDFWNSPAVAKMLENNPELANQIRHGNNNVGAYGQGDAKFTPGQRFFTPSDGGLGWNSANDWNIFESGGQVYDWGSDFNWLGGPNRDDMIGVDNFNPFGGGVSYRYKYMNPETRSGGGGYGDGW